MSVNALLETRDCVRAGCPNEADGRDGLCRTCRTMPPRRELTAAERLAMFHDDEPSPARPFPPTPALEAVAAEPDPEEAPPTMRPKTRPWTFDEAVEAVRAYRARTGETPSRFDLGSANGLPGVQVIAKLGGLKGILAAAGLTPNPPGPRAARAKTPASEGPPQPIAAPEPAAAPVRQASATAEAGPPAEAPPGGLTALAQEVDEAAEHYAQARDAYRAALDALRAAIDREVA